MLHRLLLVGLGLALALAAGEATVRLVPRRWVPELAAPTRPIPVSVFCRMSDDPRLYFELIPKNKAFQVNAAGYRGTNLVEKKAPGVRRIVGVGDSTMFGLGVPEAATYLRRVAETLGAGATARVEAVNLAVPGYNTHQELEMLRVRGLGFEPDLVIVGYDHNDARPVLGQDTDVPHLPDELGQNPLGSELWRFIQRRLYTLQFPHLDATGSRQTFIDGYVSSGPLWDGHLQALGDLAALARARGIPVLVVIYDAFVAVDPGRTSAHYRALHVPLERFAEEHGLRLLDGYRIAQDYMTAHGVQDTSSLWVSIEPRDGHPNPAGHRLLADAIVQAIRDERLLP